MATKKLMTNLDWDIYSLAGSVGLLASNVALGGLLPFGNLIPLALTSVSGGMALNSFLNNRWDRIFKNNNICNTEGQFPELLHEFKANDGSEIKYIFKMPNKLTPKTLIECQNILESSLHKPMRISTTKNFYAEITVFEKPSLNYFWYKVFKSCGFKNKEGEYPNYLQSQETKIGYKHIFKLPFGLCVEIFESNKPLIQSAINKPLKLSVTPDNKLIIQEFEIQFASFYKPKFNLNDKVKKDSKITYIDLFEDKHFITQDLVYPIGITLTENGLEITYVDLIDEPNILVAGTNGSGKTSFVKYLLTLMILQGIEIKIIDLKFGGDYNIFKNHDNLTTFIKESNIAKEELFKIEKTMNERYKLLDDADCGNYRDYNKKHPNEPMKPLVVVIDEYYMLNGKNLKIVDVLNPILAKARACNIKFILSLQRPCKDNLDPVLKANLNHTIGLRANNTYNSGIILSEGDSRLFTDLHDKGEAIILDMYQDTIFKSFYLDDDEIKRIIKPKCSRKQIPTNEIKNDKVIPLDSKKDKRVDLIAK